MSPLALPRKLLQDWIDELLSKCHTQVIRDMLTQLRTRSVFEEQWPNEYRSALARGRDRVLKLESIRTAPTNMATILSQRPDVLKWWNEIA